MKDSDSPTASIGKATPITQAAALLEAVARDSETAADFEVPIRCGQAANRLHTLLGFTPNQVPFVGDDEDAITAAIGEAITLLSSLPAGALTDTVLYALLDARAAARAMQQPPVR